MTENCGQGHDTSQICCLCSEKVKDRLWPAENALEEIDLHSLYILTGTPEQQAEAQTELGVLLLGRVWTRAQTVLVERAAAEEICPNQQDVTES